MVRVDLDGSCSRLGVDGLAGAMTGLGGGSSPDVQIAATSPQNRLLDDVWVGNLPRRVAHAVHALLEVRNDTTIGPYGPFKASEIVLYDGEALSARHTAAALREAQRRYQLAAYVGHGLWTATNKALNLTRALEDRYAKDTADGF